MRLDKFLKVARILKRRTVSKELAANQRVMVNGRIAKPATDIKAGDIIEVVFGQRSLTVRVLDVRDNVRKNEAADLYEVVEERFIEEELDT
ncbi:MAG: RNA-binding S4 domain-containing protein [Erysipelotrichaceae bacterium]|nr:RNA-binding S4 domain-containing protein [Erysipelotrichaceae bacterium]MBQ1521307.1 RNA-binding S4 domain-containing protein [Erysipelotrichaceae bacterium]MBR3352144.1 RNA-binding S4 domain-containing protein [Erysipelotrichaceae bacterium]MBR4342469.1 RNA-binding S4 domain-containing protein [Lachnospiraceae bacterium]